MPKKSKYSAREVARRLLEVFGKNGEHWIQGTYSNGDGDYCLIGAMSHEKMYARGVIGKMIAEDYPQEWKDAEKQVENFNDDGDPRTRWKMIKSMLCKRAFPTLAKLKEKKRARTTHAV